jgi:polyisoprenoid-binding protein YceI
MTTSRQPAPLAALGEGRLAGSWTLDGARSQVRLASTKLWGLVAVKGAFGEVRGSGTVTEAGEVTGTLTVAVASIDTKIKLRDHHVRSSHFLNAAKYADITFSVETIRLAVDGVTVAGSLTVRDVTRPVSFAAAVSGDDGEVTFDAELPVNRYDYGVTFNPGGHVAKISTITIHAVFTRQ